jgi:hypothetical protein
MCLHPWSCPLDVWLLRFTAPGAPSHHPPARTPLYSTQRLLTHTYRTSKLSPSRPRLRAWLQSHVSSDSVLFLRTGSSSRPRERLHSPPAPAPATAPAPAPPQRKLPPYIHPYYYPVPCSPATAEQFLHTTIFFHLRTCPSKSCAALQCAPHPRVGTCRFARWWRATKC